jgi:hypothetical protein
MDEAVAADRPAAYVSVILGISSRSEHQRADKHQEDRNKISSQSAASFRRAKIQRLYRRRHATSHKLIEALKLLIAEGQGASNKTSKVIRLVPTFITRRGKKTKGIFKAAEIE